MSPAGERLLVRAIGGVIRNAQEGELPLFAWTLGLPQAELVKLLAHCYPELGPMEPMPEPQYHAISRAAPPEHGRLVTLLLAGRSQQADPRHAAWLAHAIAAAALGSRHLWEDMGLGERADVSALLRHYFEPLYRRNTGQLKWKRFLFRELAELTGGYGGCVPDCSRCSQKTTCFPQSVPGQYEFP